ncbi:MAG: glycosyltransferase [Christensenellaceae bacterium]|nr:glycosyltransferase [Christensenellaceae bacterium]
MRILLIDVNCKNSSTGDIVYALHKNLQKEGHESLLCYGRGDACDEKGIYKFANDTETKIHALLTRITGFTGIFSPLSTDGLIHQIKLFKPDLVHVSELHSYFVNPGKVIKYLRANNIPTMWSFHCDIMYTGKCGVAQNCDKWQRGCGKCPNLSHYPKSLFFDHTATMYKWKKRLFDGWDKLYISTPSLWLKNRVDKSFIKPKQIKIIANGVDTSAFKPVKNAKEQFRQELEIPAESKIIISVMPNFNDEIKGSHHIINLAERLINIGANNVYVFVVCKKGNLPNKLPSNMIVRMDGDSPQKLAYYYSAADVFTLTSSFETFSLTTAEALCCGCPVIAFECGAPETIYAQPYAKFLSYGDVGGILNLVLEELEKPQDSKTIRRYGISNFSAKNMVNSYMESYKLILNEKE